MKNHKAKVIKQTGILRLFLLSSILIFSACESIEESFVPSTFDQEMATDQSHRINSKHEVPTIKLPFEERTIIIANSTEDTTSNGGDTGEWPIINSVSTTETIKLEKERDYLQRSINSNHGVPTIKLPFEERTIIIANSTEDTTSNGGDTGEWPIINSVSTTDKIKVEEKLSKRRGSK